MPKIVQKCKACEGTGRSSKGAECYPCNGTGVEGGKAKLEIRYCSTIQAAKLVNDKSVTITAPAFKPLF